MKWHVNDIEKGVYGELSKIREELEEAEDALNNGNTLMMLIELSDIIGAVEGIAEKYNLSITELKTFSDKVKEFKKEGVSR